MCVHWLLLQGSSVVARKPYIIQTLRLTLSFVDKICITDRRLSRNGGMAEMVDFSLAV